MLYEVKYAALLQYSPRGNSVISVKSRKIRDQIKGGRIAPLGRSIVDIINENNEGLKEFLNNEVTLVPVPRSSPIRESDLWPAYEVAKLLASAKMGAISTCLYRSYPIKKSSLFYKAEERPSIKDQYDSMGVKNTVPSNDITLVDDVITIGRTSVAAACRISEKFPNATIRVLSMIRTMSFVPDIDSIRNVIVGTITYNSGSGKCRREP